VVQCPSCAGEMREGEMLIRVTSLGGQPSSGMMGMPGMMGIPEMGLPSGEKTSEESILWREKTGQKTGWLMKSDERKIMKICGRRCVKCGYTELYAHE